MASTGRTMSKRPLMKPKPINPEPSMAVWLGTDQKDIDIPDVDSPKGHSAERSRVPSDLEDNDQAKIDLIIEGGKLSTFGYDESSSSDNSSGSTVSMKNCLACFDDMQGRLEAFRETHKRLINRVMLAVLAVLYIAYVIWAVSLDYKRALPLIIITCAIVLAVLYNLCRDKIGGAIYRQCARPVMKWVESKWSVLRWIVYCILGAGIVTYLAVDVKPHPQQLVSLVGLAVFLLLLFVFSKHPSKVQFRPVIWGLGLQFLMAIVILRSTWGFSAFRFIGAEVQKFLSFSDAGAKFVFGEHFMDHFFAFKVLPVVIFFSCAISTLYYLGVMQVIICKIAWVMRVTMKTSATESLTAAGNIFIGQTEAPILVRPFIVDMTRSELHAMMTAGFATIAGGVLAAYILFGVPAEHLLCASVMNAPVALAISKLFYPETEQSKFSGEIKLAKGEERNVLEAASAGASAAITLVANIAANLIAFLALLAFANSTVSWCGSMVGHPELSFQMICSYLFMPLAFLMGVETKDCLIVGELLGIKTFLNEFMAYEELSRLIRNRKECIFPQISARSEVICTYALCGFANLSSLGIQLGGIGPMAPSRKGDLAQIALRALIAGTTACFITASIAGLLTKEEPFLGCLNSTEIMSTNNNYTTVLSTSLPFS